MGIAMGRSKNMVLSPCFRPELTMHYAIMQSENQGCLTNLWLSNRLQSMNQMLCRYSLHEILYNFHTTRITLAQTDTKIIINYIERRFDPHTHVD